MGRLVTLSVEAYRARARSARILAHVSDTTLPKLDVFNAAIHARDKTLLDVIERLAEAFHLETDEKPGRKDTENNDRRPWNHTCTDWAAKDTSLHLPSTRWMKRERTMNDPLHNCVASWARYPASVCW